MTTSHLYEDFTIQEVMEVSNSDFSTEEIEDQKLASFETGYSSGWDDAVAAHKDGKAALSQSLKDAIGKAELSRQKVFDQFISASKPLIEGIIEKILPSLSTQVLSQHIQEVLDSALEGTIEHSIKILVSEDDHCSLSDLSKAWLPNDVQLTIDGTLTAGQVDISLEGGEKRIDLAQIVKDVSSAVEAFYQMSQEVAFNE
ncbi:MAG: hypothetical protein ABJL99_02970 [Aliishimia sp.]